MPRPKCLAAVAAVLAAPAFGADVPWVGATGSYLDSANWQGGAVPAGGANVATVDNGGAAQLGGAAPQIGGLVLGNGAGASGALAVSAGTLPIANPAGSTIAQSFGVLVGANGGTGALALTGGTFSKDLFTGATNVGYLGGASGTINLANDATFFQNWGEFRLGVGPGSIGAVTLAGNSTLRTEFLTAIGFGGGAGSVTMAGDATLRKDGGNVLIVADGGGAIPGVLPNDPNAATTGTLTMTDQARVVVAAGSQLWVGQGGAKAVGTLDMSGASRVTTANFTVVGRLSTGHATLRDDALLERTGGGSGSHIVVGDGGPFSPPNDANALGTLTLHGRARVTGDRELWVGQRAIGAVTLNDDANLTNASYIAVGREGGTGTLTLNGAASVDKTGAGAGTSVVVGGLAGRGAIVMNGTSDLTSAAELWLAEAGGDGSTMTMNDAATCAVASWVTVGRDSRLADGFAERGAGTLTLNGSSAFTKGATPNTRLVVGVYGGEGRVELRDDATLAVLGGNAVDVGGLSAGGNFVFGDSGLTSVGRLDVSGDAALVAPASPLNVAAGNSTGVVHLDGGTVTVASVNFGATAVAGGVESPTAATAGTFHLDGGTLTARAVTLVANAPGTHLFRFNGGTLRAALASDDFFQLDATRSEVAAGGARLDTAGFDIRVRQQLDGAGGLTKLGAGTLRLDRAPKNTGALDVQAGLVRVASPTVAGDPASKMTFSALNVAPGATLDVGTNLLVIDYAPGASPLESVRALLRDGRLTAGTDVAANVRLGYAEASSIEPDPAAFGSVDATSVLVRATLIGDADLSATVSFADLAAAAANYGAASGRTWRQGDFDYDGDVDFGDLAGLAVNYNSALPGPSVAASFGAAFAGDWARVLASVPEPAEAAAFGAGAAGLILWARRRRRGSN